MATREQIERFHRLWTADVDKLLEDYIYTDELKLNPTRSIFSHYLSLLDKFVKDNLLDLEKINLISGIRGVGKTTLLAQIYFLQRYIGNNLLPASADYSNVVSKISYKVYLDVARMTAERITLNEYFNYLREVYKMNLVDLKHKLIILLDEVHYDENWGLFLKSLYDTTKRHKNVLVIATGSCALKVKMNPDLSRRSTLMEMYPLKFSEFITLKFPTIISDSTSFLESFSNNFTHAALNCNDAKCVFDFCKDVQNEVSSIYSKLPPDIEEDFLHIGGSLRFRNNTEKSLSVRVYLQRDREAHNKRHP